MLRLQPGVSVRGLQPMPSRVGSGLWDSTVQRALAPSSGAGRQRPFPSQVLRRPQASCHQACRFCCWKHPCLHEGGVGRWLKPVMVPTGPDRPLRSGHATRELDVPFEDVEGAGSGRQLVHRGPGSSQSSLGRCHRRMGRCKVGQARQALGGRERSCCAELQWRR